MNHFGSSLRSWGRAISVAKVHAPQSNGMNLKWTDRAFGHGKSTFEENGESMVHLLL